MVKALQWIGLIFLIPSMLINFYLWKSKSANISDYLVTNVIDGDTFVTQDKSIIRFDTLDAPELRYCGGQQAKEALEKLVLNKRVSLNTQVRDVNGRQVASVWMGKTWIDAELIMTGWVAYSSSTVDKDHILKNLDSKNQEDKIGIYSELCTQYENIENQKCVIKGNISGEWTQKGEKSYHFPGCIQYNTTRIEKYRGEEWFCTEAEAKKAGYTKSGGCHNKRYRQS